jgi:peptidoglycan hydrolase-like protein with peptidoglycan-binding domain
MTSVLRRTASGVLGLVAVALTATLISAAPAGAATTAPQAARAAASPAILVWPYVRPGAVNERVVAIQYLLQAKGYQLRADGNYGPQTKKAVQSFQRSRHLNPSGNVGPSTWNRLIVTVRRGSQGSAVRAVQHYMKYAYGFRAVRVNGYFGRELQRAIIVLQSNSGLRRDGVVNRQTWKTIVIFRT